MPTHASMSPPSVVKLAQVALKRGPKRMQTDYIPLKWTKVFYICFESHGIIEYMPWTCIECTACDSRFKMLCCTDFKIYLSSRQKLVTYLFWISLDYWVYALTCIRCTASDARFKMLCYADFNIHRSSRRKCSTYLYWVSLDYWLYVLNLNWVCC